MAKREEKREKEERRKCYCWHVYVRGLGRRRGYLMVHCVPEKEKNMHAPRGGAHLPIAHALPLLSTQE